MYRVSLTLIWWLSAGDGGQIERAINGRTGHCDLTFGCPETGLAPAIGLGVAQVGTTTTHFVVAGRWTKP